MARGRFITLEGGEGAGKSTQAKRLGEHLTAAGLEVVITREPGGSPFAESLRTIVLDPATPPHAQLAEALLFNAARADHLERTIRPALDRGRWVICDRFIDSTRVYQGEVGGLDGEVLNALDRIVVFPTMPDLTVVIDLDPVVGLARVEQRRLGGEPAPSDRYESRSPEFHHRLREAFLRIARAEPMRCVVVNGFQAVDTIAREIRGHVEARLLRGGSV
jgi:dTMP kinase